MWIFLKCCNLTRAFPSGIKHPKAPNQNRGSFNFCLQWETKLSNTGVLVTASQGGSLAYGTA